MSIYGLVIFGYFMGEVRGGDNNFGIVSDEVLENFGIDGVSFSISYEYIFVSKCDIIFGGFF